MIFYTPTPDYGSYLMHYGIKGMKWGKRKPNELINSAHYGANMSPELKEKLAKIEAEKKAAEAEKAKKKAASSSSSTSKKKSGSSKKSSGTKKASSGSKKSAAAKQPKEAKPKAEKAAKEPKEKVTKEPKEKETKNRDSAKQAMLDRLISEYSKRLEKMKLEEKSQMDKVRDKTSSMKSSSTGRTADDLLQKIRFRR